MDHDRRTFLKTSSIVGMAAKLHHRGGIIERLELRAFASLEANAAAERVRYDQDVGK